MKKAKKIINFTIFICICALLILCCDVKYKLLNLDSIAMTVKSKDLATLTLVNGHIETLEGEETCFIADNSGRMMVSLPTTNNHINCIKINFNPDLCVPFSRLYYATNGEGIIEENAMMGYIDYADYSIVFSLPRTDVYTSFRFDTWDAVQQYVIESIEYGVINTDTIYPIYNGFYEFNYCAMIFLVLIIVFLMIFEKKLCFFSGIKYISKKIAEKINDLYFIKKYKSKLFVSENNFSTDSNKSQKTGNIFAVLAILFGTLIIFITPPMSGYDEEAHIVNVFNLSSLNMFKSRCEGGNIGLYLSPAEINFINDTNQKFGTGFSGEKYSFNNISAYDATYIDNNTVEFFPYRGASIAPISYLYSSIGVMFFKYVFKIKNVFALYLAAKFSNLIFSVVIIRLALIKTPIMRNTMFFLSLMPLTLFQLCSITYDVGAISGSFLLFAYEFKLILSEKDYRITKKDIFAVCFACACLFACKLIYIISALICIAISYKKFGSKGRYFFCISLVALMGIIFYLIPQNINNSLIGDIETSYNIETSYIVKEQQNYIISHLNIVPTVIINNISLLNFINDGSFLGLFGWANAGFPIGFSKLYMLFLVIVAIIEICSIKSLKLLPRLLSIISSSIILTGIMLSMYISFTPTIRYMINIDTIYGVQARYFIPVAIFLPIFLANPLLCKFKYAGKIHDGIGFITKCTAAAYLLLTCAVIFTAYWM